MSHLSRARRALTLTALAADATALAAPLSAQAATLKVCPAGCTYTQIQDAITAAHPGDTISVGAGTYNRFSVDRNLTISGAGPTLTIVDGQATGTVGAVTVSAGVTATIKNLQVTDGSAVKGGGIQNDGTLTLDHVLVTQNSALFGGGVYNDGTLKIKNSTVSFNSASLGGGLENDGFSGVGSMRLDHVHVLTNQANDGGGLANFGGTLKVVESVLDGNTAAPQQQSTATNLLQTDQAPLPLVQGSDQSDGRGGGVFNAAGNASIVDDTVIKKSTASEGGGIYNDDESTLEMRDIVVKTNTATGGLGSGGGVFNEGTITTTIASHITKNTPDNCVNAFSGTGC